jgi:Family of unknown function (DUF6328)
MAHRGFGHTRVAEPDPLGHNRAMDDEDRPSETEAERADRNFGDLLQELRVAQTGVQILFAFLLTMPLQNRFERLDSWERAVFVTALLLSAAATVCLIAPVAYHRALFARKMKHQVVKAAARFAVLGLALLAAAITCAVDLVLDLVLGRTPALFVAGGLALVLFGAWAVLPLIKRYGDNRADDLITVPRGEVEQLRERA